MLYREQILGRWGLWSRFTAGLAIAWHGRNQADIDLLSMNRHLRRDLGLEEGQGGVRFIDTLPR